MASTAQTETGAHILAFPGNTATPIHYQQTFTRETHKKTYKFQLGLANKTSLCGVLALQLTSPQSEQLDGT